MARSHARPQRLWIDGWLALPSGWEGRLERNGDDWGPPSDDEHALAELQHERATGTRWFAFLPIAFWWLDYYPALADTLRSAAVERREGDTIAVFRLP